MRLYVSCQGRTISLPLTRVPVMISRPDWVEEVIPHLDDEHAATLANWIGEPWAWDAIEYQYTDGDATAGMYMAADGRECTWTMMLYGEPASRAELRAHLNPTTMEA
jgi:hypothetical protein